MAFGRLARGGHLLGRAGSARGAARAQASWRCQCGGGLGSRGYHVAVVGSGPAAFYTTKYLFKGAKSANVPMAVDMFERLPAPFGLVRYGVAPDHPEVKNVINDFGDVAETAGFRFFGGVDVGGDGPVKLSALRNHYDAVAVCTGAQGEKHLGIPGEDLSGVVGAPAFVKWYNNHPDFVELDAPEPGDSVAVVGQGNVALDIARVLARSTEDLFLTDINRDAVSRIRGWHDNGLRTIHVLGRRGFVQAAFTNKELRELGTYDDVLTVVDPEDLELSRNPASEEELGKSRMKKRSVGILEKFADNFAQKDSTSKRVIWLRFLASPTAIIPHSVEPRVGGLEVERTNLSGEAGSQRAIPRSPAKKESIECGIVFRSVGFDLTPMEGVPMQNNRVPHRNGRVECGGAGGLYVAGWVKRGPTGIIATNLTDGQETAAAILADLTQRSGGSLADPEPVVAAARDAGPVVSFDAWRRIAAEELRRGVELGREADRLTSVQEMLRVAAGNGGA